MKVILEFNLPEEEQDLLLVQRGRDYFCVIWETLQDIRGYLKHGHNFKNIDEALERIEDKLLEAKIDDIN